jgi:hypothetical protein
MELAMRKLFATGVALGLVLTLAGFARAQGETQAIIDKAIKAQGGLEKVAKFKAAQMKSKGTINLLGNDVAITMENAFQWPDKMKSVAQMELMGMPINQTVVANGDKCWIKINDMIVDLPEKILESVKDSLYVERVASMVLLKDKSLEISPLGEAKIDGKDAVGLKASSKGKPDVSLYYDKESGLLLQTENRMLDPMSMQEVTQKRLFKDYKDIDGTKRPSKVVIEKDGTKYIEMEITEMKLLEKLDDNEFQMP